MPLPLVAVALGVLALIGFMYAKKPAIEAQRREAAREDAVATARGDCVDLRTQILVAAQQGQDVNVVDNLVRSYTACVRELGVDVQYRPPLLGAEAARVQVQNEWGHYLATSHDDAVKRNNTRSTWLRLARTYQDRIRAAMGLATTPSAVEAIEAEVALWVQAANERTACFVGGIGPCSRAGVNEPHNNDRARDEYLASVLPFVGGAEAVRWFKRQSVPFAPPYGPVMQVHWPDAWFPAFNVPDVGIFAELRAKRAALLAAVPIGFLTATVAQQNRGAFRILTS